QPSPQVSLFLCQDRFYQLVLGLGVWLRHELLVMPLPCAAFLLFRVRAPSATLPSPCAFLLQPPWILAFCSCRFQTLQKELRILHLLFWYWDLRPLRTLWNLKIPQHDLTRC